MAVEEYKVVKDFSDWYTKLVVDPVNGGYREHGVAPCAEHTLRLYEKYRSEMNARTANFDKLEKLKDGQVISTKPDLPNVSSGEVAGLVRRAARNIVQNTPNVEVLSTFDDDSVEGIMSRHILLTKVIGTDSYSNDMQQNLFASTMSSFTFGFNCVVPVLLQDAAKGWYIKYDTIHYNDVFPEDGAKDVRQAHKVFVRRYLTKADVHHLIEINAAGWDIEALKTLMCMNPPNRNYYSNSETQKKSGQLPEGFEIATLYTDSGDPFLTFDVRNKLLLRIEQNKHPLKEHPVHFLILEKDDQQPLGKSMVELLLGRQEFQDLLLNGAMKMWYWGINPTFIGRGVNSGANLGPGKFMSISNPNASVETLEVSTQTLLQHGTISQQNMGSMVNILGAADQQMAAGAGNGMSATPQGVEAQQSMVDITTNNYQKAVENFFSHYCSYALTIYFQELKSVKSVKPNAEARQRLLAAGLDEDRINDKGEIELDWENLATQYFVRCVPGSLVELEDDKEVRILTELFVPLSQAMPAIAQAQDEDMMKAAVQTMQYIMGRQIQLSGARDAKAITQLWQGEEVEKINARDARIEQIEQNLGGNTEAVELEQAAATASIVQLQAQVTQLTENFSLLLQKLGVQNAPSGAEQATQPEQVVAQQ